MAYLRLHLGDLSADEAVLVVDEDKTDEGVKRLRRVIRWTLPGRHLVVLEDLRKHGVWVYRVPGDRPLVGGTVGLEKAQEIRSRPVDK